MAAMKLPVKLLVAVAALGVLALLFWRSVRTTRAEPYTVHPDLLRGWTLVAEQPASPAQPALSLRPPPALANELSLQLFKRAMESLDAPEISGMPLVLGGELARGLGAAVTAEVQLALARQAGLEGEALVPRCLGYRRLSDAGGTRQLYFVLFDSPAFVRFRTALAAAAGDAAAAGAFEPAAQSPVVMIATSGPSYAGWLPLRANAATDCVAPIVTSAAR